jgi:hypothetical protein
MKTIFPSVAIRCPFHMEQSPSCIVNDESYQCFGCDAKGTRESLDAHLSIANKTVEGEARK